MRYTIEKFAGGLLVEKVTYELDTPPADPPSLPNEDVVAAHNGDGIVIRGPWGVLHDDVGA